MLSAVSGINLNRKTNNLPQNRSAKINLALRKASFESNPKHKISFGGVIPQDDLITICEDFIPSLDSISNVELLKRAFDELYQKFLQIASDTPENKISEHFHTWRHELDNIFHVATFNLTSADKPREFFENLLFSLVEITRADAKIEGKEGKPVLFEDVLKKIKVLAKRMRSPSFSIKGTELLQGRVLRNPELVDLVLSHLLLNAIKHGENEPFQIIIKGDERLEEKSREFGDLFISFLNPDTKVLSEDKIEELLKGERVETARFGRGLPALIKLLREHGYEEDLSNLIERNREKGVCITAPLFQTLVVSSH